MCPGGSYSHQSSWIQLRLFRYYYYIYQVVLPHPLFSLVGKNTMAVYILEQTLAHLVYY